jgi:photosystem II stability/assembly factor-like uncharacterized protein
MFWKKIPGMVLLVGMLVTQTIPRALAATQCDSAQFVSDLTVPDGAVFAPGTTFIKTWRLRNIGTCTWTTSYKIVWGGGDQIGAPASVKMPVNVAPGQMVDISVNMITPFAAGHFKGLWKISNAAGVQFGIGLSAIDPFWVDINVIENKAVVYDFVANAPYAQWKSGAGALPFPVTGGDDRGYAFQINNPHLEDDSLDASPGLMTVPQNKLNGYIQATYPEIQIQQGDQLQTLVNCEFAATSCYVTFRVDYLLSNGLQKTLWSWKETYDKRFYRANITLNSLAGQKVRFVFMLLSSGSASGDRAIWGSPRIVRAGATQPPAPPPTFTPLPPLTPTLTPYIPPPPTPAPAGCNKATFVSDVTVPDGTLFSPGTTFIKTWRLKNSGTCTWTNAYKLVFYSGEQMSAPTSVNVPWSVSSGQTVDLTVNMVAPSRAGSYRGYWILANASGVLFGIGADASKPIWVDVNVTGPSPIDTGYDFAANACAAQWKSGAGILPCPGTEGDIKGYAISKNSTQLEDGTMGPAPSLLLAPENKYNGYIQGTYPLFTVQPGDRFRGNTGCAYGASCYVTFRLDYMTPTGAVKTFWTWRESNDRKNNTFDVNLSSLAGQNVRFILTILATGSAINDRATWVAPIIVRLNTSDQIPPTLTPTNTPIIMPGTIVYSPMIRSIQMFDAFNGWALTDSYVLRTNDSGTTWYNVTVPGISSMGGASFQTATRAWIIAQVPDTEGSTLFHTIDGGRTWTSFSNLPFRGGSIRFINDANGFVFESEPVGMHKQPVWLYQTMDGGATWTLKYTNDPLDPNAGTSLPFGGLKYGVTFRDTLTGWVGGMTPMDGFVYLYKTTDGGVTWSQQPLALPPGYQSAFITTTAPTFFGPNDAILPVRMGGNAGTDLFIYITHDGGATWKVSSGFARNGDFISFASLSDAFSWDFANIFHVTNDSGNTWRNVTPNVPFGTLGYQFLGMDFVSTTTGWVVVGHEDYTTTSLYRTTDGGSTWTLLSSNPPLSPTPTPNPAAFAQSIVGALNARNFDAARAAMDQTFATGYWGSQGTSSTADQAIETFRTYYLGTTPLTSDASKDLTALLGGMNPYAIMGLDLAKSYALFVSGISGWGADGKSEAILYITQRADGSLYWYGMLVAPVGFAYETPTSTPTPTATFTPVTPTTTSTPVTLMGPYAVVNVSPSDVLNIRSGAGVSQAIIGYYPPDATDVMRTGTSANVDGAVWVEVRRGDGLTGWVNSYYLTEFVTHEAFCADGRIPPLIEQAKQSMIQSNGSLLGPIVSPVHGVNMHLWAYGPGINFTQSTAANIYADATAYNWGGGPSGIPDTGTFNDAVKPKYLEVFNAANMETYCDALTKVYPLSRPWPYENIRFYNLYKPASDLFFDFRTLLIGVEYIDGQPYIYGMVTIIWEP